MYLAKQVTHNPTDWTVAEEALDIEKANRQYRQLVIIYAVNNSIFHYLQALLQEGRRLLCSLEAGDAWKAYELVKS